MATQKEAHFNALTESIRVTSIEINRELSP